MSPIFWRGSSFDTVHARIDAKQGICCRIYFVVKTKSVKQEPVTLVSVISDEPVPKGCHVSCSSHLPIAMQARYCLEDSAIETKALAQFVSLSNHRSNGTSHTNRQGDRGVIGGTDGNGSYQVTNMDPVHIL